MTTSVLRSRETAGNALSGLRSSYSSDRERPWPASASSSSSPSSSSPPGAAREKRGSPFAASVPRGSSALERPDLGQARGSGSTDSSAATPSTSDFRSLTSRATTISDSPTTVASLLPPASFKSASQHRSGELSPALKRRRASDDYLSSHQHHCNDPADMSASEDYMRRRRSPAHFDSDGPRKSQRLADEDSAAPSADRRLSPSASPAQRPPKREEDDMMEESRRRDLMRREMEPARELPPLGGYRGLPPRLADRSEGPSPRLPSFASLSGPKDGHGMPSILSNRPPGGVLGGHGHGHPHGHGPSSSRSSSASSPSMSRHTVPAPPAIHPSLAGLPGAGGGPGSKQQPSFVSKLYSMLEDRSLENMISWGPDGSVFSVANPADFSRVVLPNWFKHSNWQSFVRQLNMYGFHKVNHTYQGNPSEDVQVWEFKHPSFRRGEIQLLNDIKRKSSRHKRSASQSLATGGGPGSYDDGTARSLDGRSTPSPDRPLMMEGMYGREPMYAESSKYERAMLENRGGHHHPHHHPAVLDGRGMPGAALTSPAMRGGYPLAPPSMPAMTRPAPPYPAGGPPRGPGGEPLPAPYYAAPPPKESVVPGPATFSSEAAVARMDELSDRIDAIIRHATYLEQQLRTVTDQLHHSEQNEAEMVRHIQHLEVKVQDLTEQLAHANKVNGAGAGDVATSSSSAAPGGPSSAANTPRGGAAYPSGPRGGDERFATGGDARSPSVRSVGASPRSARGYGSGMPAAPPPSGFEDQRVAGPSSSSNASGPLPTPPASAQPYEYRGPGARR